MATVIEAAQDPLEISWYNSVTLVEAQTALEVTYLRPVTLTVGQRILEVAWYPSYNPGMGIVTETASAGSPFLGQRISPAAAAAVVELGGTPAHPTALAPGPAVEVLTALGWSPFLPGMPVLPCAVRDADDFDSGWQARPPGLPDMCVVGGLDLVGFPLANPSLNVSATAVVVANAPVPAVPTSEIQLGRDDLNAVLDYAQHLAMLKRGGAEFAGTVPLLQAFFARASRYNASLRALATKQRPMYDTSRLEDAREPVEDRSDG